MASYKEFEISSFVAEDITTISDGQYFSEAYVSYPDYDSFSTTLAGQISPEAVGSDPDTFPNTVFFSFDMDYDTLIREKSPFANYIANTVSFNPDILEDVLSKITLESVTIYRVRVDVEGEEEVEIVTGTPGGVGVLDAGAEQDTDAIFGEQWSIMQNETDIALHATGQHG